MTRLSPEDGLGADKVLDLLPHHGNAAVVRCVQLQRHVLDAAAVDGARNGQHRGGLAST